MKKTTNTTQRKEKPDRNVSVLFQRSFEHYRNMEAEKLAQELITDAVTDETILSISTLLLRHQIEREEFRRLIAKYPVLDRAKRIIMLAIGERRELGGLTRKFDTGIVLYSMPFYDTDWKELTEWKAKLTHKENTDQTIRIITEPIPTSELVPERKLKGESNDENGDCEGQDPLP